MAHPSEVTPVLTDERLRFLASAIAEVRSDALEVHEPERGDNAWTFGCVAYKRTCHALMGHADSGLQPWLTYRGQGLTFTMFVEGVPLKFYRGPAAKPGARNLRKGLEAAIIQGALAFVKDELGDWFWLLAIETKEDGTVLRIAVFQTKEGGACRNQYLIEMDGSVPVAASVGAAPAEGIEQAPPTVGPKLTGGERTGDGGTATNDVGEGDDDDQPIDPKQK